MLVSKEEQFRPQRRHESILFGKFNRHQLAKDWVDLTLSSKSSLFQLSDMIAISIRLLLIVMLANNANPLSPCPKFT